MKSLPKATPQRAVAALGALLLLGLGSAYGYVRCGGMSARQKPSSLEAFVGQHLVQLGIPADARLWKNPMSGHADGSDAARGRELYRRNCEGCHGADGEGATALGVGLYPPPISLGRAALDSRGRTDGELFYLIRNGVRNTGMPGWQLPDNETWDLVSYLRNLPLTNGVGVNPAAPSGHPGEATYIGSAACKSCHVDLFERWAKTPMANVVRDPREHPEAIIPDLSRREPLVTFTVNDVALVYGSRWKQRYFTKVGDDYYPLSAQWDVTHRVWKPYFVKDDWWAAVYPPSNAERPTSALCDGCHSVNYNIESRSVTEWNVGCERCHGPGSEHAKDPTNTNVVNPLRMGYVAANDVCIQCHSQGRPIGNPIRGTFYDWPVGYDLTGRLSDVWKLEEHSVGDTTFTHFADGTAHKNRMQGNDFVTSAMYTHGVTCFTCHDSHGTSHPSNLRKEPNALCQDCHSPGSPNGPHAPSLAEHTHHREGSAGSACIDCHMPKVAQTIGDVNVRSHTFRFVSPADGERMKMPNACNICHTGKSNAWATSALKSWRERSPWRVAP